MLFKEVEVCYVIIILYIYILSFLVWCSVICFNVVLSLKIHSLIWMNSCINWVHNVNRIVEIHKFLSSTYVDGKCFLNVGVFQ